MGTEGTFDKATGKVKEAAGDLTGDEKLQAEGKTDQFKGDAKNTIDKVGDKVKDVID
ncbi:MAG: CsbD family protein [Dehalococcoidia bacterium]